MSLFALVSILISLAAVSSYVNYRYIKLPTTIGVMLVALVASLALVLPVPTPEGSVNRPRHWFRRSTSTRSYCTACSRSCCSPARST